MYDIDIKGMCFARVMRCSEDEQEIDSFAQQEMTTDRTAERFEVTITETHRFPGFSATTGQQVQPYLDLIARYAGGRIVQGFVLDAYSRWARSEADEARLYAACRDANLLILTDKEGLMMGAGTWAKRGAAADQSEAYARDVGRHVNRAVIKLIIDGLIPPTLSFPWGFDREYYDPDGKPTFRVRKLPDGRCAVLDPEEPHAVRFYIAKGNRRLHLRERGHSFKWIPSSPEIQAIAKEMLRRHYIDGVSATKLCADFNRRSIPSHTGKLWKHATIRRVLRNSLWIGKSVGFVLATGRHGERDKDGPKQYPMSLRAGYKKNNQPRKGLPRRYKNSEHWVISIQPKLVNFLDNDVREAIDKLWQYRFEHNGLFPTRPISRRSLPPKSRYFLSGILQIESDGRRMIGTDAGYKGKDKREVYRYYVTRREETSPIDGAPKERVNAEVVESEVKNAIRTVLSDFEVHVPKIIQFISDKKQELVGRTDSSAALRAEKSELEEWYKNTFSMAGSRGRTLLAAEAQRVERRLGEIDIQLAEAGALRPDYLDYDVSKIVDSVKTQVARLPAVLDGVAFEPIRALSAALLSKLTFNPVTRVISMDIALPSWALSKDRVLIDRISTGAIPVDQNSIRTNSDSIPLMQFSCNELHVNRKQCFICYRSPLAHKDAA